MRAMNRIWRTIRSYILWTHDRGSMHYDVMVTLILAFLFVTPYFVNFKDKPVARTPHQTEIVVLPDGDKGFIYQVEAGAVRGGDDSAVRGSLERIIEPIAGEVEVRRYEAVRDGKGHIIAYKAWVRRP
jgi:hypothetical protein